MKEYKYLDKINSPEDIKRLSVEEMEPLAAEIRDFLIEKVNMTGGHLASNLGVVELSMAIHRVFDSPKDHIIWDVGHQSYVHKMLTGRRDAFDQLRKPGGLAGFTRREESEHDCFGAGHSSTSVSAALGFAEADKMRGSDAYTVAVVGDGAFTGGMIHEALNNCKKKLRLIIIINENEMSISKNIGLFAKSLSRIRIKPGYFKAKDMTGRILKKIPFVGNGLFRFVLRIKKLFKNIMYGSNYFEDLGLYYLGPVDGNNYAHVEAILSEAKKADGNVVIHLKTVKGKGYAPAESSPDKYHGVSPSEAKKVESTLTSAFGDAVCRLADENDSVCAVTAAMCDGTGLVRFKDEHPDRFFDVGIAEEHAVTFGAGLAADGMRPCVAVYSTFLQRAYDNIIHDVALQKLPVTLCIDRAGLNAKDGPTHHGIFDVAFLSQIPGMRIYTPVTAEGVERALRVAVNGEGPAAVRYANYPENQRIVKEFYEKGIPDSPSVLKNYDDGAELDAVIVTYGKITKEALAAADELAKDNIRTGVILLEYLKPYEKLAADVAGLIPGGTQAIVYLEEEIRNGGAGMLLSDKMSKLDSIKNIPCAVMATDDDFAYQKAGETVYESAGVSAHHVADRIKELLSK